MNLTQVYWSHRRSPGWVCCQVDWKGQNVPERSLKSNPVCNLKYQIYYLSDFLFLGDVAELHQGSVLIFFPNIFIFFSFPDLSTDSCTNTATWWTSVWIFATFQLQSNVGSWFTVVYKNHITMIRGDFIEFLHWGKKGKGGKKGKKTLRSEAKFVEKSFWDTLFSVRILKLSSVDIPLWQCWFSLSLLKKKKISICLKQYPFLC